MLDHVFFFLQTLDLHVQHMSYVYNSFCSLCITYVAHLSGSLKVTKQFHAFLSLMSCSSISDIRIQLHVHLLPTCLKSYLRASLSKATLRILQLYTYSYFLLSNKIHHFRILDASHHWINRGQYIVRSSKQWSLFSNLAIPHKS